jgi:acyl-CoA thioester hydrolase
MESPIFVQQLSPSSGDIDALGHVNNLVYLRWVQDIAVAHSDAVGWDFAAYQREGSVFVVRRHEVEYLRPALLEDTLELRTFIVDWRGASSWRETRIFRQRDGQELAHARTLWVFVDKAHGRPRRIPASLLSDFRREVPGTLPMTST